MSRLSLPDPPLSNGTITLRRSVAQKAGYTREGLLRCYRRRQGEREDLVMFSLLAEEVV